MATRGAPSSDNPARETTPPNLHPAQVPTPSLLWAHYQSMKGFNSTHLTLPAVDLRNKWIILTGGNSGIGRCAALQFVSWGANIILGCRSTFPAHETHPDVVVQELKDAAEEAGHEGSVIEWWECDMGDLESVEGFGRRWLAWKDEGGRERALDLLINNAGIGGYAASRGVKYSKDGFELVHQVNFISHVLLTLILLPSLARSPTARIICSTSCMHYLGEFNLSNANAGFKAYENNKLYLQTWLTELQSRMSKNDAYKHIVIHGHHPGFVNSNIWVNPKTGTVDTSTWFRKFLVTLRDWVAIDSQQGSLSILHAATAEGWGGEGNGGKFANRIWEEEAMPQTKHEGCRRVVWEFVGEELKLNAKGLLVGLED